MILAFYEDDAGATAIEYGMTLTLISILLIGSLQAVGTTMSSFLGSVNTAVSTAGN